LVHLPAPVDHAKHDVETHGLPGTAMKYVSYVTHTKDKARIAAHRPAHREYLSGLPEQGKLVACGPFPDDSGALFVYEVDCAEAAAAIVAQDPFFANGVFESRELKPWTLVFSNAELLRSGESPRCLPTARCRVRLKQ
jgi:uncharacterized protein YciI